MKVPRFSTGIGVLIAIVSVDLAPVHGFGAEVDGAAAVQFLLSHEKGNGAFGPRDQQHTDLAWNYPAVHALVLLGQKVPRPVEAFANGRSAAYLEEASHQKMWSHDVYERAHLAHALKREPGPEYKLNGQWAVEYVDREGWYYPKIDGRKLRANIAPFNEVASLWHFVGAVTVSGGTVTNTEVIKAFLYLRQCASGAFEDAYRAEASRDEMAAHLVATAEAVLTLRAVGLEVPNRQACIEWIRSCQASEGGFRWHPANPAHSNKPDVWYTWYAVKALQALGARPKDVAGCASWINSLQNADGGFGDRPGWRSRLYSTYFAVHALEMLSGDALKAVRKKTVTASNSAIPEGTYRIFQAHLKSPSGGAEMVEAAREIGFSFLGVKSNTPDGPQVTVEEARRHVGEKGYALELVANPENYGHKMERPGGHPAHHVSNWLLPPAMSDGERRIFGASEAAARRGLPWAKFKTEVIEPVLKLGTLVYPEMDYGMMNAYMVYDDGLDGRAGYNAVIGALGWPPWDWIRMFPYRERWIGQLPIVADGDAHGDIIKWGERLDRQRVLYIAKNHGLGDFLEACREGRTVCVIRRGADRSEVVYYGAEPAVAYVKKAMKEWQWWK